MTNKADWKLIHIGEAKTTVKGFFGQPLGGHSRRRRRFGLSVFHGSPASPGGEGPKGEGSTGSTGFGSSSGSGLRPRSLVRLQPQLRDQFTSKLRLVYRTWPERGGYMSLRSGFNSGGIGGQSATSFTGGGAPIVGIGCSRSGGSITMLNEQTTYQTWEFIYDPRIEQLKAKAAFWGAGQVPGLVRRVLLRFGSSSPTSPMSPGMNSSPSGSFGSSGVRGSDPSSTSPTPNSSVRECRVSGSQSLEALREGNLRNL